MPATCRAPHPAHLVAWLLSCITTHIPSPTPRLARTAPATWAGGRSTRFHRFIPVFVGMGAARRRLWGGLARRAAWRAPASPATTCLPACQSPACPALPGAWEGGGQPQARWPGRTLFCRPFSPCSTMLPAAAHPACPLFCMPAASLTFASAARRRSRHRSGTYLERHRRAGRCDAYRAWRHSMARAAVWLQLPLLSPQYGLHATYARLTPTLRACRHLRAGQALPLR